MTAYPCPHCGSSGADVAEGGHDCFVYIRGMYEALQLDHKRVCADNESLRAALFAVRPGGQMELIDQ